MAYLRRTEEPHQHVLPHGMQFATVADQRKCFRDGKGHLGTEAVLCAIDDCKHKFGTLCTLCDRVV